MLDKPRREPQDLANLLTMMHRHPEGLTDMAIISRAASKEASRLEPRPARSVYAWG